MAVNRKAVLGRGLNALLPTQNDGETDSAQPDVPNSKLYKFDEPARLVGRVADIEVDRVVPNPYQPRRDFDPGALDELAASIVQLGVIQPITVRQTDDGYEIISGERRLRASKLAGLKRIPAYVRDAGTEEMLEMALVENVQREQLNPIEVALGYQRLIDEVGLTQEQVADRVGKNRATVANTLRLLRLPPRVQASLRDNRISAGHARALITLDDESEQVRITEDIEEKGLSVREVEDRVRAYQQAKREGAKPAPPRPEPTPVPDRDTLELRALTDRLRSRLSTQVQIKNKNGGGGRIEIAYYSDEDLERLMELLLV